MRYVLLSILLISFPLAASAQAQTVNEDATGFYNRTGTDLLLGSSSSTARFYTINGYRFNQQVSAGLGVGYVPYNDPIGLISIFADLNYIFSDRDVSPFLFLRMGYGLSTHADEDVHIEEHEGGIMINPGLGLQFSTSKSWSWYFNAGYNRDRSAHSYETWGNRTVNNRYSYRRVNLGIGVMF
ncbi:hypothetical protein BH23BAC3_BH23BAC3_35170 [soil metagenome]